MLRKGAVAIGAALAAGLLMGAVARLMMRLVSVAAGHPGEFSTGGTIGILLTFVVLVVPGALLAAFWRGRGRSLLLVAATLLLLVVASGIAMQDIGNVGVLSAGRWVALVAAALGVYAAILALPVLTLRIIKWGLEGRPVGSDPHRPVAGQIEHA